MSHLVPGEPLQQVADSSRISARCRIPQKFLSVRQRTPLCRAKVTNNTDIAKPKLDATATPQLRSGVKNAAHPRFDEPVRPKSASRTKDELTPSRQYTMRSSRPERERLLAAAKRPSAIPKRVTNGNVISKVERTLITVPVIQRPTARKTYAKTMSCLPDQETIKKCEDLELKQSELLDTGQLDLQKKESLTCRSDKMMQLKIAWQDKMVMFEQMKNELKDRQKAIMELYASMDHTYHKMIEIGQKASLPPPEELRIMNVAKMTPEQLLQLCAGSRITNRKLRHEGSQGNVLVTIDINRLYNMPTKLVSNCEQTLVKRKEIIDWFEKLKSNKTRITMDTLSMKLIEFNAENEMLQCSLEQVKEEFSKELNEIIDYIRKAVNKTVVLELRIEELTLKLSEVNSQNVDLHKQLNNADHLKSYSHKNKIEDLEKQLKEERCQKSVIKDRLSKSEGQVKMYTENAAQLVSTLEQSRAEVKNLGLTIQKLKDQNQIQQSNFDKELNKLTESIKENTVHLEEIADARETLQTQKEDLEKRLGNLSEYYNESIQNMKHEMNVNVSRLIETENKYEQEKEEKKKLEMRADTMCAQLMESGVHQKELVIQLQEQESKLKKMANTQKDYESTKSELERANKYIDEYKNQIVKQSEANMDTERNFKISKDLVENLKEDLSTKEEYITELENEKSELKQQLQESEFKMSMYDKELTSLKTRIAELQEDFGEFENLNELHEMVNQQRANLLEATRQNGELAEALQNKDIELDRQVYNFTEQEHLIEQRDGLIKMLSEKDEEQANIIKLLQNNLEIRTRADSDLNQQLAEKNIEIESLINNLDTRKKQISQLEKIILTLEDQTRYASLQIRKHQDKINLLEKKIIELETFHMNETPTDNLDNLIKLLEDELGSVFEPHVNNEREYVLPKKKRISGDRKRDNLECLEGNNQSFQTEYEAIPTKVLKGNFLKKNCVSTNDEQFKGDNLDRKEAITNIETQKWNPTVDADVLNTPQTEKENNILPFRGIIPYSKDNLSRNLKFLATNQLRDEKKCKMFKFAGHRL